MKLYQESSLHLEKTFNRKKLATPIGSDIEFDSSSSELIKKVKNCILKNITNPNFNVAVNFVKPVDTVKKS